MPRVNFYLLQEEDEAARRLFACRLAEKLQREGLGVQLYVSSSEEAAELDRLLWQFTPESFVPHALVAAAGETVSARTVQIGWADRPGGAANLLNLSDAPPPDPGRFATISEFVPNEAHAKAQSRERWQFYRRAGCELQHHQL